MSMTVGLYGLFSCLTSPSLSSGVQVACMQLINALVTSPDELDFRLHLRNEFMRCGLKEILPVRPTSPSLARAHAHYVNTLSPCINI